MSGLRQRPGDQPLPVPNRGQDIQSIVIRDVRSAAALCEAGGGSQEDLAGFDHLISDIAARRRLGIERYGTALQAYNGRDVLRDAYEEALDFAMYVRQGIEEQVITDAELYRSSLENAHKLLHLIRARDAS